MKGKPHQTKNRSKERNQNHSADVAYDNVSWQFAEPLSLRTAEENPGEHGPWCTLSKVTSNKGCFTFRGND